MHPLKVETLFPTALWDSQKDYQKAHRPSKTNILGFRLPGPGPLAWGARGGAQTLPSLGRTSVIVNLLLFVGCPPGCMALDCTMTPPFLSCRGSFFIYTVVEDLFW